MANITTNKKTNIIIADLPREDMLVELHEREIYDIYGGGWFSDLWDWGVDHVRPWFPSGGGFGIRFNFTF